MSTTTDAKPKNGLVFVLSLCLYIGVALVVWLFARSSMTVNPQEIEKRAAEVEKRERQRLEEEREKRKKIAINEDDAEKLRKKARKKEEKKIADKVREMRDIQKRVREERDASLQALSERTLDDLNQPALDDLVALAKKADESAYHLSVRTDVPIADATKPKTAALVVTTETAVTPDTPTDWAKVSELLRGEAGGVRNPLVAGLEKVLANSSNPYSAEEQHGQFVHPAQSTIRGLDNYITTLEELVTSSDVMDQLNDLGDVAFPDKPMSDDFSDVNQMDLDQLVEESEFLEKSIAEDFSEMRAAEMAQLEGSSFEEAMSKISEANSGSQSQSEMSSGDQQQQSGSEQSGSQSESGESQAGSETASSSQSGGSPSSPSVSTVGDLQDYRAAQAAKSQQATGNWTKAVNMAQQAGALGSRNTSGRSSEAFAEAGQSPSSGQGRKGKPGAARGKGGDGGSKISSNRDGSSSAFRSRNMSQDASSLRIQIPTEMIRAKALPGRRFSPNSERQGWLFLDTWYIIGPWDNKGKLDYTVIHPPEIGIDLDADYTDGKFVLNSKTKRHSLRWQFVQSDIMRITPPMERGDSTYYAYTEVYFEEATEMLVAIASDDAARMWVNDKLIWEDQGLSGWSLDEGFRVASFKKGFNNLLVRIENGPVLCEYSVLLCPTAARK